MSRTLLLFAALPAAVGCSDPPSGLRDAHVDAVPIDAPPDAFCGANLFYTGEYVDWDSSDAQFLGIFNATWAVADDTTSRPVAHTAPNGRFLLCINSGTDPSITITPDPTNTGSNGSDTYLPGVALAKHLQIASGIITSTRSMRLSRAASLFQQIGDGTSAYDAAKGQLFVHASGSAVAVALSISAASLAPQAYGIGEAWAAGSAGTYVYFPNIELTGPTVTLSAASAIDGTGDLPISAGHLTYVEVEAP